MLLHIANVLIYGRLWIAFCVFCFVQSGFAMFRTSFEISPYAILMALGSYLFYILPFLYYGIKKIKRATNPRQLWIEQRLKSLYGTGVAVLLGLGVAAFYYWYEFIDLAMNGLLVGILALLYMLPLIPYKGQYYALRQLGLLKPFMLAFVWWYMGAYLIAVFEMAREGCLASGPCLEKTLVLALQFMFMWVMCMLFDIRDYDNDKTNGIKTWPVFFGIKTTQKILFAVCLVGLGISVLYPFEGDIKITFSILFVLMAFYNTRKLTTYPWWFYDVAVDGLMIVQWGLLAWASIFYK